MSEQDRQQQRTDRPTPGDQGTSAAPGAFGDPERNPMTFLFRPGNRALYRGRDDDKTV